MKKEKFDYKKIDVNEYGKLLYEMDIAVFNRDFDYPSPSIKMTLDYLKNCEVYLIYTENDVVGLFALKEADDKTEVRQLIVLPKHQNKGYGKKIIKEILRIKKGKSIWLIAHPKNIHAIILYLKNGFVIQGWKDNYYGDGQPRIILNYVK